MAVVVEQNPSIVSPSIVPEVAADARRAELFRETLSERLERLVLGLAWPLKPKRIGGLPALASLWLADLIAPEYGLPDPHRTLSAEGLCGMAHDLSVATLVAA